MFDPWGADVGDRVERMPDGRKGTVVDVEFGSVTLTCGCCSEPRIDVEVLWDGSIETDFVDPEELRKLDNG